MDAIEAILNRKVQRAFAAKPVEADKLSKIVEAGRHAMSARNLQPWQFIVVRDRERLKAMGAVCTTGRFVADAPSAVVILKDTANARWADVDCAQAVQNMATAGWALGLGTCWVGNSMRPNSPRCSPSPMDGRCSPSCRSAMPMRRILRRASR